MHSEWCELAAEPAQLLNETRMRGGRIVAVGTTSLRTIESAYRASQVASPARGAVEFQEWRGETDLFVRPPTKISSTDALLTNFHLPKSTLLMLVTAFGGLDLMLGAYHEAIEQRYRFYSYGDAMLIL
jgi:S-adenosylmethionine:tRNA ribosyltransferase-isomerase